MFRRLWNSLPWSDDSSGSSSSRYERRAERTETSLDCDLVLDDDTKFIARVIDLTVQGARVAIRPEQAERFKVDQVFRIAIRGPKTSWQVQCRASVRHVQASQDGWIHMGLIFVDLGYLFSQLDDSLSVYFNRRSSKRVSTLQDGDFLVKLRYERTVESGRVVNLSATGMGLVLNAAQAMAFQRDRAIHVRFTLPGTQAEIACKATIRHRSRLGAQEQLGLEFDAGDQVAAKARAKAIEDYIRRLQKRVEKILRKMGA